MAVEGPLGRVQDKLQVLLHKGLAVLEGALVHGLPPGIGHLQACMAITTAIQSDNGSSSSWNLAAVEQAHIRREISYSADFAGARKAAATGVRNECFRQAQGCECSSSQSEHAESAAHMAMQILHL